MGVWGRRPETPPVTQHQLPLGEGRLNWGRWPKTPARNTPIRGRINSRISPCWTPCGSLIFESRSPQSVLSATHPRNLVCTRSLTAHQLDKIVACSVGVGVATYCKRKNEIYTLILYDQKKTSVLHLPCFLFILYLIYNTRTSKQNQASPNLCSANNE